MVTFQQVFFIFLAIIALLGPFALMYLIFFKSVLSVLQRTFLVFFFTTLSFSLPIVILLFGQWDALVCLLALPPFFGLMMAWNHWYSEKRTVHKIRNSPELSEAIKGKIYFYHKESNWKPTISFFGRIEELEDLY